MKAISLRVVSFSMFLFVSLSIQSQTATSALAENLWHIDEVKNATGGNAYSPSSFKNSILYLTGEAVVAVQYSKDEWGAVRINEQGKVLWQARVKGPIAGITKFGEHILLFYTDEEYKTRVNFVISKNSSSTSSKINAVLINAKTGKAENDKTIFNNGAEAFIESCIVSPTESNSARLLVRVSNSEKSRVDPDKELKEKLTSAKLVLLEIKQDLTVKTTDIRAAGKDGLFLGAQVNKSGLFFFASIIDEQVVVERFDGSGVPTGKLAAAIALRTFNMMIKPVLKVDESDENLLLMGLHFRSKGKDIVNQSFGFDFASKKVNGTGEEALDKAYKKSLQVNEIKGLQNGSFTSMEPLTVVDIITTKDKIALVKEIQFTESSSVNSAGIWYRNDAVVVSVYDRHWKLLTTITLDKKYEANMPRGRSVGLKLIGENLHFIMPAVNGVLSYATAYAVIDLQNLQLKEFKTIDKAGVKKLYAFEGGASIWMEDGVMIEYFIPEGGAFKSRKDVYSMWQKIKL